MEQDNKPQNMNRSSDRPDRRGRGGSSRRGGRPNKEFQKPEYDQKVLDIARVSRVTKGGKRFSFRTTIAIGDNKGKVGVGMAKGKDVVSSIQKAYNQAKKNMIIVSLVEIQVVPM